MAIKDSCQPNLLQPSYEFDFEFSEPPSAPPQPAGISSAEPVPPHDLSDWNISNGEIHVSIDDDSLINSIQRLLLLESKRRPRTDYMENLQTHINPMTRAHCVDKLVSDARRLNYVPATLYLAVNYLDRYLSCNLVENDDELRLVGLTCMMLASKYEEAQLFDLSDYMDVVAGKIARSDLVRMECVVLNQLKHELSVPTAWTFLEMFATAEAFGTKHDPSSDLKSKSSCIAEISLVSYHMLRFQPSLVAAASVFLALYTIEPNKFPWTAALQLYTIYRPSDLCDCVEMLHQFLHKSMNSDTLSIFKKYRREKAAWKDFPTLLHPEIFNDLAD